MINQTKLLRDKFKYSTDSEPIFQHPTFSSILKQTKCQANFSPLKVNIQNQSKKKVTVRSSNGEKILLSKKLKLQKESVDLVSCYKSILEFTKKKSPNTQNELIQKKYHSSKDHWTPQQLQTIQERLISQQDQNLDELSNNKKTKKSDYQYDHKEKYFSKQRKSTNVSNNQNSSNIYQGKILDVKGIAVRPFTTSLGKIKVSKTHKKLSLDVGEVIAEMNLRKVRQSKQNPDFRQRYYSR